MNNNVKGTVSLTLARMSTEMHFSSEFVDAQGRVRPALPTQAIQRIGAVSTHKDKPGGGQSEGYTISWHGDKRRSWHSSGTLLEQGLLQPVEDGSDHGVLISEELGWDAVAQKFVVPAQQPATNGQAAAVPAEME